MIWRMVRRWAPMYKKMRRRMEGKRKPRFACGLLLEFELWFVSAAGGEDLVVRLAELWGKCANHDRY